MKLKNNNSIIKTTIIVSLIVLVGKVLGFFREAIIAAIFGANVQTDAFFFAQNMPAMIFPAVCSSISTAFLSQFVVRQEQKGYTNVDRYASKILNSTILIGFGLGLLGIVLSPILVSVFGPGFTDVGKNLAIHYTKLIMGAFVLNMIQYMFCAILNSRNIFIASQVAGLLYNVVIIILTLVFGNSNYADILMISVIIGLIVQDIVLFLFLYKRFNYQFLSRPFDKEFWGLFITAMPILVGNCAIQINTIIDQILGSMLPSGALSSLTYSMTLITFVTSIFVTSLSTVLYPNLSSSFAKGDQNKFRKMISENLYLLSYILVPITVLAIVLSNDIVTIVYGRGEFDAVAIKFTSLALKCYSPMILFVGFREILNKAFFSHQNNKIPMYNTIIGSIVNAMVSIALLNILGVGGIAIGTTVATFVTTGLLMYRAKEMLGREVLQGLVISFLKQILSGIFMGVLIVNISIHLKTDVSVIRFAFFALAGMIIYMVLTFIFDSKNILAYLNRIKISVLKK